MRLRHPIRALPTTFKVIAGLLILLGLALALAQDQETIKVESTYGAGDARFPPYAATLVGSPLTRGNAYEVISNGNEIFDAMLKAIDAARQRISFETYIYSDGRIPDRFTDALARAAQRGVSVRLLVDAVGGKKMTGEAKDRLTQAGADLGTFNPLRWWMLEAVNYRMHRKILVVDGESAFTGGVGVADDWVGPKAWRDTQVRVAGPDVASLEAAFFDNWIETGHRSTPAINLSPSPAPNDSRSLVLWSSPTGGASNLKLLYLLSIAAARRTLDIQSPYFVLDESTWWALQQARTRGVKVRVLVEGDLTDAKPVKYASRESYDELLEAGVEIAEYQPTMMHAKVLVVDGTWSLIGSANFDNRSFELNDEITVAVTDANVAARLTSDFERDLTRSRRLTRESWEQRPFSDKLREWIWSFFGELF